MRLSDRIYNEMLNKYPEIVNNEDYLKLRNIKRHGYTDTFAHSLRVAAVSECIADKLGVDTDSVIKTALLHDFCLVDYHQKNDGSREIYILLHPKEAAENSRRFELTETELRAIRSHMFPIAPVPTSKVAWVITLADKAVAAYEGCYGFFAHIGCAVKHRFAA